MKNEWEEGEKVLNVETGLEVPPCPIYTPFGTYTVYRMVTTQKPTKIR